MSIREIVEDCSFTGNTSVRHRIFFRMSAHRARLGLALALSPLAAPVAVWLGVLARAAVSPGRLRGSSNPVVDALLLAVLLVAYTAPAAYSATLVFAWPLFPFLQS